MLEAGNQVFGDEGHHHNFGMSCILQNTFNAYIEINSINPVEYEFKKYCNVLSKNTFRKCWYHRLCIRSTNYFVKRSNIGWDIWFLVFLRTYRGEVPWLSSQCVEAVFRVFGTQQQTPAPHTVNLTKVLNHGTFLRKLKIKYLS